ncbi:MAG: ABC transporter permease [Actinomycetota bacterium]|nr:ABC transporter permease [Actinomycetota bacterium]
MNIGEAFRSALRGLRANRLRSALTTLGIVIGVSSVIVLVALGNGLQTGFNDSFGSLGTQVLVSKSAGSVPGGGPAHDLTDSDVAALRNPRQAPDIASVTPVVTGTAVLQSGNSGQFRTSVAGSTADYLDVTNRNLVAGRFFTAEEERSNARVVVLGPNPVVNLFGSDAVAALGRRIRIGRATFQVIGVVKGDGQKDEIAIMPLGAARSYLLGGTDAVNQIIVKAGSVGQVPAVLDEVTALLSQQHHIRDPAKRDFEATALQGLLDQATQTLTFLSVFTVAVAAISLIVGGIGVANIMLVSVTERTREIGIRKAVGAPRSAIVKQFLIESCVLAAMGGLVGIVLGVGLTVIAGLVLPANIPNFPAPEVSVGSVLLAFGISLAIGLLAGGFPAIRAASMRPIDALRYE